MERFFRLLFTFIIIAIILFLIWRFSSIVAYILISAVLSFMGHPLVKLLDKVRIGKVKIPHVASTIITLLLIIGIIASFIAVFVPMIMSQISMISQIDFNKLSILLSEPLHSLEAFLIDYNLIGENETLQGLLREQLESFINVATFGDIFSGLIGFTGSIFIGVFSVIFITFFFLKDEHLFFNGIMLAVPSKHKEKVANALLSVRVLLSRYFIGLFVEVITMMTLITLGCTILGIENALVIGFFGGLMNIIPYLGPIIGATIGVILGITSNVSMDHYSEIIPVSLKIIGTFVGANLIDNMVLQPWIYSTSVRAHPLEIFLVILVAGILAGPIGMILAIPGYTVIRIVAKQFLSKFEVVQKLTERL